MSRSPLVLAAALAMLAGVALPASAQEEKSRYTMAPADGGGVIRLDSQTGQMAHCQRRDGDWSCREMAEPDRGLNQEIERLRADNQRLKAEIRQMEDIFLGDKRAEAGKPDRKGFEFKVPSEQEIDSAMSTAQRLIRKFREMMKEFEGEQKGTPL